MKLKVGISARHIHLTRSSFEILFGKDASLTKKNDISQIGQYASNEVVDIKNDYYEIKGVRILGPLRDYNQIELSKTDCIKFKIDAPIRDSGDLENSETLLVVGPKGTLLLENSVIIPTRHIHLDNEFASLNNFKDGEIVSIYKKGEKGGRMDDVHVKVNKKYVNEIHLDTDDANSFLIKNNEEMEVIRNA